MTASESEARQPRLLELITSLFRGRETKQRDLMLGAAWQLRSRPSGSCSRPLLEASDRNLPEHEPHGRSGTKTVPQ